MAVRLGVRIEREPTVGASIEEVKLGASLPRETALKTSIGSGVSVSAKVVGEKVLRAVTDAVTVMQGDWYAGPYVVTPTLPGFEMDTHGKNMAHDVTVRPIPIAQATNQQNGYTVVIG